MTANKTQLQTDNSWPFGVRAILVMVGKSKKTPETAADRNFKTFSKSLEK
jgi:hypothetical protein